MAREVPMDDPNARDAPADDPNGESRDSFVTREESMDMNGSDVGEAVSRRFERAQFGRWFGIYFAAAAGWFFAGVLLGVALAQQISLADLAEVAGEGGSFLPEKITVTTIAVNNLVALGVDALGLVSVGLASVLMLLLNGLFVGLVVTLGASEVSPLLMAALILPHGVVELPAFWLVAGIGFRIYHRLARFVVGWDEAFLDRQELFEAAVLLVVAVIMILVAAVIEVHVTPWVAEALTGQSIDL